jgi:hypothetical protein
VRIGFTLRTVAGLVTVHLAPNEDPAAIGCPPHARGFPVCTASVRHASGGYAAMLGWIQLVRSTDNASRGARFEMDPFEPLGSVPHPFCWFGLKPTLFDAPSRRAADDMKWVSHSFLGFVGDAHEARAILGFSWGFTLKQGRPHIVAAEPLRPDDWNGHLPLLRDQHQSWEFAPDFRQD